MEVTIKNWDKYNPKRDQKSYTWLRLPNDFYMSDELFFFKPEQIFVWTVILCEASRSNSPKMTITPERLSYITKVENDIVLDTLHLLSDKGLIDISHCAVTPCQNDSVSCTRQHGVVTTTPKKERKKASKQESIVEKKILDEIDEIVNHLNSSASKSFRRDTQKTVRLLTALLVNYTTQEIKKVIGCKSTEWLDSEYEKYLRPETLFGNKFENYYNQSLIQTQDEKVLDLFQGEK